MKTIKLGTITAFLLLNVSLLIAQTENAIVYKATTLKAGIYHSFYECAKNTPAIPINCDPIKITVSNKWKDTTIQAYDINSSKEGTPHTKTIWGFSNGKEVYVKYNFSLTKVAFWKLIEVSGYPFFVCLQKSKPLPEAGTFRVASINLFHSSDVNPQLIYINQEGKFVVADAEALKKLFQIAPTIYKDYMADISKNSIATRIRYLHQLNQYLASFQH